MRPPQARQIPIQARFRGGGGDLSKQTTSPSQTSPNHASHTKENQPHHTLNNPHSNSDKPHFITYTHQAIKRNYQNPEEQVQALIFCKLILDYNYPQEQIRQFVKVQMGSSAKEADIIVYSDKECKTPHIIIECKKRDISDLEFANAVNQAFSYAVAEGAKFVWVSSGLKDEYYQVLDEKPKDRILIPDIPAFSQKEILEYKFVQGGQKEGKKYFDLAQISQDELTQVFKQAHNALWGGGELNPSAAFDELDKLIFCKIWDEKNTPEGEPYAFQTYFAKNYDTKAATKDLARRIYALYEQGRKKDPEVFKEDIRLSPEKIRTVVSYLEKISLSQTDLDSKGRAFETFMGSFFRGDFGQYFTPRNIVKFIVEVLPIDNASLVLDTSCGSGGFLLHALDKVRKLADSAYPTRNTPDKILKHHSFWHDFAEHNLYGIEINEQIARVAKMNMIIHDDGHTNVISCDGLSPIEARTPTGAESNEQREALEQYNSTVIAHKSQNPHFKPNHFDYIITNPPFGSTVKQSERAYLQEYHFGNKSPHWLDIKADSSTQEKRENQSTEVLFIEQAHRFLKEKGFLAIVIPDGILTNSSLQYVRDSIEEMYRIVAVVSMPQSAFAHTGAGVKSSVLFLQKHTSQTTEQIKELKLSLQTRLKSQVDYINAMQNLESAKKQELKELNKSYPTKEAKQSEAYIHAKSTITLRHKEQVEALQTPLLESYQAQKAQEFTKAGLNYEVFMALAQNIGYDATGKPTGINDLDSIAQHLRDFIAQIAG